MMGLLSDPLCSPGAGRKVPLVGAESHTADVGVGGGGGGSGSNATEEGEGRGEGGGRGGGVHGVCFDGGDGDGDGSGSAGYGGRGSGGGGGGEEDDPKVAAALEKALVLLEDADMMRRMLEKLLEFDEKKYTTMFQATGILDQVLQPLLKRVLTLNVGGCPGAAGLWRAMRHPEGLTTPTGVGGRRSALPGGPSSERSGGTEVGWKGRVEETGALALVSRATRLLCGTLALLLGSSQAVCRQFRALRMHDTLYSVIR